MDLKWSHNQQILEPKSTKSCQDASDGLQPPFPQHPSNFFAILGPFENIKIRKTKMVEHVAPEVFFQFCCLPVLFDFWGQFKISIGE